MMTESRRVIVDRAAARLALVGAALGILAGLVDLVAGPSIRDWVGNRLDPTRLGLATVALSAIALTAAFAWRRAGGRSGGRRLATILALALPGAICFSTIGRLWYLPGVLLLGASILILWASRRADLAGAVDERRGLVVVLGGLYVFLGADARGFAGLLGVLGGLLIWTALLTARKSQRVPLALIAIGALPLALATWWSAVTPLSALLVLILGRQAIRPNDRRESEPLLSHRNGVVAPTPTHPNVLPTRVPSPSGS